MSEKYLPEKFRNILPIALLGLSLNDPTSFMVNKIDPNKTNVQEATDNQTIILTNPQISHVASFPWIGPPAIIAILESEYSSGQTDNYAFVTSADCIKAALKDQDELGAPSLGIWNPHTNLNQITASVSSAYSILDQKPVLNALQITNQGITYDCHQPTAKEDLTKFVKSLELKNFFKNLGRFTGQSIRDFLDGLHHP